MCVTNGGTITQHFNLEKHTCQSYPISMYIFYTGVRTFISWLKNIPKQNTYKYLSIFSFIMNKQILFLKDSQSTVHLNIYFFSLIFGTEAKSQKMINGRKRSPDRGFQLVVCGIKRTNLCNETIKISGTYCWHSDTIREGCHFLKGVSNVHSELKLWLFWNLNLKGNIVSLKV